MGELKKFKLKSYKLKTSAVLAISILTTGIIPIIAKDYNVIINGNEIVVAKELISIIYMILVTGVAIFLNISIKQDEEFGKFIECVKDIKDTEDTIKKLHEDYKNIVDENKTHVNSYKDLVARVESMIEKNYKDKLDSLSEHIFNLREKVDYEMEHLLKVCEEYKFINQTKKTQFALALQRLDTISKDLRKIADIIDKNIENSNDKNESIQEAAITVQLQTSET